MTALAVEFFTAKLASAAGGGVGGTVPATLSLTLGVPASFGAVHAGRGAGLLGLDVGDRHLAPPATRRSRSPIRAPRPGISSTATFSLPQPLQARATRTGSTNTAFAAVGSPTSPLSLLSWSAPVSNDPVTLEFKQTIGANDALRTGAYSKTLTFTLSTSTP